MLRNVVKAFITLVMIGDILCVFAIDPRIALGRIVILITIVWAWRLY